MPEQGPAKDAQRKFAGKYESVDDLEKGYSESTQEGLRLKAQLDQAIAENRALKLAGQSRQNDPDPDLAALEEAGIDTAVLNRAIQKIATGTATGRVEEALAPLFNAAQAQQRIPADLQQKANALLASDPEVSATYQALLSSPERAANYLTREVRFHDAEAGMHEEDARVKAERQEKRRDAALPAAAQGSGRGEDHEAAESSEREAAQRKSLLERAQRAGGINKAIASEFFRGKLKVIDRLDEPPRVIS